MPKKSSRDWRCEENYIITTLGQMEFMKLKLHESQHLAERFTKEFEKLTRALFAGTCEENNDMVEFRLGIDRERWSQFHEACNRQEGCMVSPAEVERKASDIWGAIVLMPSLSTLM